MEFQWSVDDDTSIELEGEDIPSLSLWPMKNSMPFIPRDLSFADGKVVKVGRRHGLVDLSQTGFFDNYSVSREHAELSFDNGSFYVR